MRSIQRDAVELINNGARPLEGQAGGGRPALVFGVPESRGPRKNLRPAPASTERSFFHLHRQKHRRRRGDVHGGDKAEGDGEERETACGRDPGLNAC